MHQRYLVDLVDKCDGVEAAQRFLLLDAHRNVEAVAAGREPVINHLEVFEARPTARFYSKISERYANPETDVIVADWESRGLDPDRTGSDGHRPLGSRRCAYWLDALRPSIANTTATSRPSGTGGAAVTVETDGEGVRLGSTIRAGCCSFRRPEPDPPRSWTAPRGRLGSRRHRRPPAR